MIHTLTSSGYLYKVRRNRQHYLNAIERRRAFLFVCLTTAVLTFGVIAFILQSR